jgi:hypothetical protein
MKWMTMRKEIYILQVKWKKATKEMRDKKAARDDVPEVYSNYWEMVSK